MTDCFVVVTSSSKSGGQVAGGEGEIKYSQRENDVDDGQDHDLG